MEKHKTMQEMTKLAPEHNYRNSIHVRGRLYNSLPLSKCGLNIRFTASLQQEEHEIKI